MFVRSLLRWLFPRLTLLACCGIGAGATAGCAYLKGTSAEPVAAPVPPATPVADPIVELPVVEPPATASDSAGIARLVRVAALWDAVRLFHPSVARRGIEWDSATVRALPAIRSARNIDEYADALRLLLGKLGDPMTRVYTGVVSSANGDAESTPADATTSVPTLSRTVDGTSVVRVPDPLALEQPAVQATLRDLLARARIATPLTRAAGSPIMVRLVLDLRTTRRLPDRARGAGAIDAAHVVEQLATAPLVTAGHRRRVHEAWGPDDPATRDTTTGRNIRPAFASRWLVADGTRLVPEMALARGASVPRIAIVVNRNSPLSTGLLALVSARQAVLVADGALEELASVPVATIGMGSGVTVEFRVSEWLNADGTTGALADTVITTDADTAAAMRAAVALVRGSNWPRVRGVAPLAVTPSPPTRAFDNAWYPPMGARLLGAFRIWATLRAFHAYRDLYDEDLDAAFARILPRFEAARDSVSYTLAVADLASTMDDAQGAITGPMMTSIAGVASAPFRARFIEGRAIVTAFASDSIARAFGLSVGDEITAADGFPTVAWMSEHRRLGGASNEWTRQRQQMMLLPRGPQGSADFRVRDAAGKERVVTLPRRLEWQQWLDSADLRGQAPWRELPGNIGYLDLERISTSQVDSAFQALGKTRALILDLRGALSARPAAIWSRLATLPRFTVARFAVRMAQAPCVPAEHVMTRDGCDVVRWSHELAATADTSQRYRGRLVLLIDERTRGDAELLALGLENGANATFIGSASAGASGTVSRVQVPGELTVHFAGVEVRHADGRQLERVGLTPHVDVRPTVKGIRSGVDDVLDRAQQYLLQLLDPVTRRRR